MLEVDAARWSISDASFVNEALAGLDGDPATVRRVRGTVDVRFADVEEEHAWDNPAVQGFVRDMYDRAPWIAYYLVPSTEQQFLYYVSHGATTQHSDGGTVIRAAPEVVNGLENALLTSAIYAVEHGDDWRMVVEPWSNPTCPSVVALVREILSLTYDRHSGLRLTSAGWVSNED